MKLIERRISKKGVLCFFTLLLLIGLVSAVQETLMGVQGKAVYSNGSLIGSGDVQIKVTESDCGSAFFTENYPYNISDGYFNILLGNLNPLSLDYNKDYYLCLYINNQLQEPIQKFRGGQGQINANDIATTEDYIFRNVTANGSVTADYFYGDGSQLTGLPSSGMQYGDYRFAEKNESNTFTENQTFSQDIIVTGNIYGGSPVKVIGGLNINGNLNLSNEIYFNQYIYSSESSIGIGKNPQVSNHGIAIGENAQSSTWSGASPSEYGIAIGYGSTTGVNYGKNGVAIGKNAIASNGHPFNGDSIAIGTSATAGTGTVGYSQNGIAIGHGAQTGTYVTYGGSWNNNGIAIGENAKASIGGGETRESIAIGTNAKSGLGKWSKYNIALGSNTIAGTIWETFGTPPYSATNSIAIGYSAISSYSDSIAFGRSATTTSEKQLMIGSDSVPLDTNITGNLSTDKDLIVSGKIYGDGSQLTGLPTGGAGMDYTNIAMTNQSNEFTQNQSISYPSLVKKALLYCPYAPYGCTWATYKKTSSGVYDSTNLTLMPDQTSGSFETVTLNATDFDEGNVWGSISYESARIPNIEGVKVTMSYKVSDVDDEATWNAMSWTDVAPNLGSWSLAENERKQFLRMKLTLSRNSLNDESATVSAFDAIVSYTSNLVIDMYNMTRGINIRMQDVNNIDPLSKAINFGILITNNQSRGIRVSNVGGANQGIEIKNYDDFTGQGIRLMSQTKNSRNMDANQYGDADNINLNTWGNGTSLRINYNGISGIDGNLIDTNKGFKVDNNGKVTATQYFGDGSQLTGIGTGITGMLQNTTDYSIMSAGTSNEIIQLNTVNGFGGQINARTGKYGWGNQDEYVSMWIGNLSDNIQLEANSGGVASINVMDGSYTASLKPRKLTLAMDNSIEWDPITDYIRLNNVNGLETNGNISVSTFTILKPNDLQLTGIDDGKGLRWNNNRFEFYGGVNPLSPDVYTSAGLLQNATNCNSLDTDANGLIYCGTDETGTGDGMQYGDYQFAEKNESNTFSKPIYIDNLTVNSAFDIHSFIDYSTFPANGSTPLFQMQFLNGWDGGIVGQLMKGNDQGHVMFAVGGGEPQNSIRLQYSTPFNSSSLIISENNTEKTRLRQYDLQLDTGRLQGQETDSTKGLKWDNNQLELYGGNVTLVTPDTVLKLTANTTAIPCDGTNIGGIMFSSDSKHHGCDGTNWNALY